MEFRAFLDPLAFTVASFVLLESWDVRDVEVLRLCLAMFEGVFRRDDVRVG